VQLSTHSPGVPMHHRCMSNNVFRARLVETWCMSVMTFGALGVVLGAPLTIASGELLLAACVVPPLVMLRVWRPAAPIALTVAS
jgi:hypothetical protein